MDFYARMRTALEGLQGRYRPDERAVWYDNFAADRQNIFSFVLQSPVGPGELRPNPQLEQIRVFAETLSATGSQQTKVLSLSANGEVNYSPEATLREVLSPEHLQLMTRLTGSMESAQKNPQAYQIALGRALSQISGHQRIQTPQIQPTQIQSNIGAAIGPSGEPILEFREGWDLFRNFHVFAGHRWQNPQNPVEVRNLKPTWRLSRVMGGELARWIGQSSFHSIFRNPFEPRLKGDYLRLHLYPQGGGEVTIYRDNQLHDVVTHQAEGGFWRAGDEIRRMETKGNTYPNRLDALRAAVEARSVPGQEGALRVQEAPLFDLERFHLQADGTPLEIRDAQTAWDLLQRQIPPGVEPRVRNEVNLRGKVTGVQVDFYGSQPSLMLKIRGFRVPAGAGTEVPRVVIQMQRGQDRYNRVFEDGQPNAGLAKDLLRADLLEAQRAGARSLWRRAGALGHGYAIRRLAYAIPEGGTFALGHILSTPIIQWAEAGMFTPAERRMIGTPSIEWSAGYFYHHLLKPYVQMTLFSGIASVGTDATYNSLSTAWRSWRISGPNQSFGQIWRSTHPGFFNPNPIARPVRQNFIWRGVQRFVPLFAGLTALDFAQNHRNPLDNPMFLSNLKNVGLVSAGSAAASWGIVRSETLSRGMGRLGLMRQAGAGVSGARFTSTLRGAALLAVLEFTVIGILNARDRRATLSQVRAELRSQLGSAIDRRNELITRLEHGEEIPPRQLLAADQALQQAQGIYRRFLELDERRGGTGQYQALTPDNDFQAIYDSLDRQQALAAGNPNPNSDFLRASLTLQQENRLRELRERYARMERETAALYARFGVPEEDAGANEESLTDFLRSRAEASETAATLPPPETVTGSPIPIDSPQAGAILEQLRWKAAQEPSFVLWSPIRRADYILRQFRGYRVREADGTYRPWNRTDALAFLGAAAEADAQRARNMQEPLTLPQQREGFDTTILTRLLDEEREIREREMSSHTHTREHAERLAENVEDLDRQMEQYLGMSNERMAIALERFIDRPQLAALNPTDTNTASM